VQKDPEERRDLSGEMEEKVEELKDRIMEHFQELIPRFADPDDDVSTEEYTETSVVDPVPGSRIQCFLDPWIRDPV
jgi:hypothetical protein